MHKKIVYQIKSVLEMCPAKEYMNVYTKESSTEGFWKMLVIVDRGKEYLIPHIRLVSIHIGRLYGENLCINVDRNGVYID